MEPANQYSCITSHICKQEPYIGCEIYGPYYYKDRFYIDIKSIEGIKRRTTQARFLMELHIKRILNKNEEVHHKNENKSDDRIENYEILTTSEHMRLHNKTRIYPAKEVRQFECPECGKVFEKSGSDLHKIHQIRGRINPKPFCSHRCSTTQSRRKQKKEKENNTNGL